MNDVNDIQSNYSSGYIKLFRSLKNKGWYKKSDFVHLWIHLLIKANHKKNEFWFNGKSITVNCGQFITGRKQLCEETGINESKIERILTYFEKIEQQIEQQKTNRSRLISIIYWNEYQQTEQQTEQQLNNKRTTTEQQLNTNKNVKNVKNVNKEELLSKIQEEFYDHLKGFVSEFDKLTLREFYDYWSEPNKSKTKIRWQLEKTWDTKKRLERWTSKNNKFNESNRTNNKNGFNSPETAATIESIKRQFEEVEQARISAETLSDFD